MLKQRTLVWLGVFIFIFLAVSRPLLHPGNVDLIGVYKTVAHIFVGVLGTLAYQGNMKAKWLFWLISVEELLCAVLQRI